MAVTFPSLGGPLVYGAVLLVLYVLYRAALPKPLKGIPYNQDAAGKLFGDVPEMMGYVMRTKRIFVRLRGFQTATAASAHATSKALTTDHDSAG